MKTMIIKLSDKMLRNIEFSTSGLKWNENNEPEGYICCSDRCCEEEICLIPEELINDWKLDPNMKVPVKIGDDGGITIHVAV